MKNARIWNPNKYINRFKKPRIELYLENRSPDFPKDFVITVAFQVVTQRDKEFF